jgi:DNA polymerase-1
MSLLIDADYTLYKNAAACEIDIDYGDDVIVVQSRFSELQRMMLWDINKIRSSLEWADDGSVILFFSDSTNFRKEIYPEYKGHRNRKKPCGYKRAIEWLKGLYEVKVFPTLEADDALGIWQTTYQDEDHILVSPDKDMRQIPGRLYDLTNPVVTITPEEGNRWHLIQTLAGDQTDGYGGCPGIGIKKAEALFDKHGESWATVVGAFEKAGLKEDDALLNARLARILQSTDYDHSTGTVRLWNPASRGLSGDAAEPDSAV